MKSTWCVYWQKGQVVHSRKSRTQFTRKLATNLTTIDSSILPATQGDDLKLLFLSPALRELMVKSNHNSPWRSTATHSWISGCILHWFVRSGFEDPSNPRFVFDCWVFFSGTWVMDAPSMPTSACQWVWLSTWISAEDLEKSALLVLPLSPLRHWCHLTDWLDRSSHLRAFSLSRLPVALAALLVLSLTSFDLLLIAARLSHTNYYGFSFSRSLLATSSIDNDQLVISHSFTIREYWWFSQGKLKDCSFQSCAASAQNQANSA